VELELLAVWVALVVLAAHNKQHVMLKLVKVALVVMVALEALVEKEEMEWMGLVLMFMLLLELH